MMINYVCKLAYVGTAYKGWQIQAPGIETVEHTIEQTLYSIFGVPIRVGVCSRTDAGVHALGQIGSFQAPGSITLYRLFRGLNALLNDDISILDLVRTEHLVNVRKENRGKRYIYHIHNGPVDFAFSRTTSWCVYEPLNLEVMRRVARHLVGSFDFSAFQGKGCNALSTFKTITKIEIQQRSHRFGGDQIKIIVEGQSFLKNMVRIIVGALVDIGRGKLNENAVQIALKSGKRSDIGITAPPHGLFLDEVFFDKDLFENGILAIINSRSKS